MTYNRKAFTELNDNYCHICDRKISFSHPGKFCAHCRTAVHLDCDPGSTCNVCGNPFEGAEIIEHELEPLSWGSE